VITVVGIRRNAVSSSRIRGSYPSTRDDHAWFGAFGTPDLLELAVGKPGHSLL
jgi:hypothetical protein